MQINEIKPGVKKIRKRVGRGGKKGTYSGKGMKGQKARAGFSQRATFEGGKSTLIMHTKKKRGFKSLSGKSEVVSLEKISKNFESGEKITKKLLKEKNLIKNIASKVKILSDGEINKKIIINSGILISKAAEDKIKKAGGDIEDKKEASSSSGKTASSKDSYKKKKK